MTEPEGRKSLVELLREERPLDAAAARAAVRSVGLMNEAFSTSDLGTRRDLAEAVGVSEGRISQLLNGDGNVRVSTLARVLKASGFDLELTLAGVDDSPARTSRRVRRKLRSPESPMYVTVRTETAMSEGIGGPGIEQHTTVELTSRHPQHEIVESAVEWVGTVEPQGAQGRRMLRYTADDASARRAAPESESSPHV